MGRYEKAPSGNSSQERSFGRESVASVEKLDAGVCTLPSEDHPEGSEDRVFVGMSSFGVYDGVGGHAGGRHASTFAANRLGEAMERLPNTATVAEMKRSVERLFHETNVELLESKRAYPHLGKDRATTASVVKVLEDFGGKKVAVVGHVGGSRVYVVSRGGELRQVTIDDDATLPAFGHERARAVQRALSGAENPKELDPYHQVMFADRHVVTQALGKEDGIRPQVYDVALADGDRVLITSDGIHDNLTTREITHVLSQSGSTAETARHLVQAARDRSKDERHPRAKPDDMSAVIVTF